jgi:hypothetical protein
MIDPALHDALMKRPWRWVLIHPNILRISKTGFQAIASTIPLASLPFTSEQPPLEQRFQLLPTLEFETIGISPPATFSHS